MSRAFAARFRVLCSKSFNPIRTVVLAVLPTQPGLSSAMSSMEAFTAATVNQAADNLFRQLKVLDECVLGAALGNQTDVS